MSELLPCPFCGGEAELRHNKTWDYEVRCTNCRAKTRLHHDNHIGAVDDWNSRAERVTDDEWEIYQHSVPATEENMAKFGWVRERTCKFTIKDNMNETEGMGDVWIECSACNCVFDFYADEWLMKMSYCPNCGARVMDE